MGRALDLESEVIPIQTSFIIVYHEHGHLIILRLVLISKIELFKFDFN